MNSMHLTRARLDKKLLRWRAQSMFQEDAVNFPFLSANRDNKSLYFVVKNKK